MIEPERGEPLVGNRPVITLRSRYTEGIVWAQVAPGRGMLLLQAVRRDAAGAEHDLLDSPPLAEAAGQLDGGPRDFAGNAAFSFGGAILLPYANRIPGRALPGRMLEADLRGQTAQLPRNWGGSVSDGDQYAMHGLILDLPFEEVRQAGPDMVTGRVRDHDFRGRWPSRADITVTWRLIDGGLDLTVETTNVGGEVLPLGVGWHPWFRLPSGRRDQARLHIPAVRRALVGDYDAVLPTGVFEVVAGSTHDVAQPQGMALRDLHIDDCFTDLEPGSSGLVAELNDPAAGLRIQLFTDAPPVRAVQVYAPPDRAVVALEPQYNLADPYGAVWPPDVETGMVCLAPGESSTYRVRTEVDASTAPSSRDHSSNEPS